MPSSIMSSASSIISSASTARSGAIGDPETCTSCYSTVIPLVKHSYLRKICPLEKASYRDQGKSIHDTRLCRPCYTELVGRGDPCPVCRGRISSTGQSIPMDSDRNDQLANESYALARRTQDEENALLQPMQALSMGQDANSYFSRSSSGRSYAEGSYTAGSRSVTPTQEIYNNSQYSEPHTLIHGYSDTIQSYNTNTAPVVPNALIQYNSGSQFVSGSSRQMSGSSNSSSSDYTSSPGTMSPIAGQSFYGSGSVDNPSTTSFGTISSRASTHSTASDVARHTRSNGESYDVLRSDSGRKRLDKKKTSKTEKFALHVARNI